MIVQITVTNTKLFSKNNIHGVFQKKEGIFYRVTYRARSKSCCMIARYLDCTLTQYVYKYHCRHQKLAARVILKQTMGRRIIVLIKTKCRISLLRFMNTRVASFGFHLSVTLRAHTLRWFVSLGREIHEEKLLTTRGTKKILLFECRGRVKRTTLFFCTTRLHRSYAYDLSLDRLHLMKNDVLIHHFEDYGMYILQSKLKTGQNYF